MSVRIRPYERTDAAAVAEIWNLCYSLISFSASAKALLIGSFASFACFFR